MSLLVLVSDTGYPFCTECIRPFNCKIIPENVKELTLRNITLLVCRSENLSGL